MTVGLNNTALLDLPLPVEGYFDGTWGNLVNYSLTNYLDIAIAGTLTLSGDGAVTLTNTAGDDSATNISSTTAQYAVVKITGTLTTTKVITAPSTSKIYVVDNAATGGAVTFKASGQTGVSVAVGEKCTVYFNGTDYVKVASSVVDGVSTISFGSTGLTPSTATSGDVTVAGTLAVANGGTGVTTSTGTGNVVLSTSPTLVTPILGTPTSATLTNATGLPISTGVSGLGSGVATFLATPSSANLAATVTDETGSGSLVFATSPTLVTPALGTPSSATLTNATGLPISTGVSGLGSGVATFLATPSSANLASAVSDETGTGALVFANSPTLVTPILGTPTSATLTNATGLPISTGVSGLGTGVATALAVNVGSAGAPIVNGGVLGTPSSGTATNLTGLPLTTGVTGTLPVANGGTGVTSSTGTGSVVLSASPALTGIPTVPTAANGTNTTQAASTAFVINQIGAISAGVTSFSTGTTGLTPSLATSGAVTLGGTLAVTNGGTGVTTSTGTGNVVLSNSPTLVTPALGTPASGVATNLTGLPLTTGVTGILPVANGGNGTATPALTQGSNVTITGSWPNYTISASAPGTGTVTSVSGTGTVSGISLSGTVTSTGSLTLGGTLAVTPSNFASQTANTFLAAPNGSSGTPTFRALAAADVPTLNQNTTGTAASTPKLLTTNFTIEEVGGKLIFKYGATTIASMTSAGVFTTLSDINGNGTP